MYSLKEISLLFDSSAQADIKHKMQPNGTDVSYIDDVDGNENIYGRWNARTTAHTVAMENQVKTKTSEETITNKNSNGHDTTTATRSLTHASNSNHFTLFKIFPATNINDYTQTPLYNSFAPLMVSLRILGLHYCRQTDSFGRFKNTPSISQAYSWTVTSMIWLMTLRSLYSMRLVSGVGLSLLSNLLIFVWLLLCAVNATNFLVASHLPKKREFFDGFSKLKSGAFMCPIRMKKLIAIGTAVSWMMLVFNVGALIYLTFHTPILDILSTDPIPAENTTACQIAKYVFMVVSVYLTAAWVFPSALELSLSVLIYSEFTLFRKSLASKMADDGEYKGSLEADRRRFLEMVNIVQAADSALTLHHGAAFVCNIVNVCLILYCMIHYPSINKDPTAFLAFGFWLGGGLLDITVVCLSGILVNSSVSLTGF